MRRNGHRYQKTIVFCVDPEHAARARQAMAKEIADLVGVSARYVMRITGEDAVQFSKRWDSL